MKHMITTIHPRAMLAKELLSDMLAHGPFAGEAKAIVTMAYALADEFYAAGMARGDITEEVATETDRPKESAS